MERRERELMKGMNTKIKTFYEEQLKRDEAVLSFLEKREEKMEASMLKKAEGFKYIYKEQFKGFGKLMKKRDKEMEIDNNYRHKLWNDSLDQVNSNLVKMHTMLTEIERSMNTLGTRQDQLITLVEYTNDYGLFNREGQQETIPKFSPSLARFDLEPPNLKPSISHKRRK